MYARVSPRFFFFSPSRAIKGAARGCCIMCVELVGEKLPPHSMCGSLIFDRRVAPPGPEFFFFFPSVERANNILLGLSSITETYQGEAFGGYNLGGLRSRVVVLETVGCALLISRYPSPTGELLYRYLDRVDSIAANKAAIAGAVLGILLWDAILVPEVQLRNLPTCRLIANMEFQPWYSSAKIWGEHHLIPRRHSRHSLSAPETSAGTCFCFFLSARRRISTIYSPRPLALLLVRHGRSVCVIVSS